MIQQYVRCHVLLCEIIFKRSSAMKRPFPSKIEAKSFHFFDVGRNFEDQSILVQIEMQLSRTPNILFQISLVDESCLALPQFRCTRTLLLSTQYLVDSSRPYPPFGLESVRDHALVETVRHPPVQISMILSGDRAELSNVEVSIARP